MLNVTATSRTALLRSPAAAAYPEWRAWPCTATLLDAAEYAAAGDGETAQADRDTVDDVASVVSLGYPAAAAAMLLARDEEFR